jgi:transglutaminase-like putative cysteine protease
MVIPVETDPAVVRALKWGVHKVGGWTLVSLLLLMVAMTSLATQVSRIVRELDFVLLWAVAALAVLVGWALAKSPFPGRLAAVLACILGAEGIFTYIGRLGAALVSLAAVLADLAWETVIWWWHGPPPDATPLALVLTQLWDQASTLLIRIRDWSSALVSGRAAFDPLAAALVWSLVLWVLSAWAAWAVRRHYQPLPALAPAGAFLATALFIVGGDPSSLLIVLAALLLLMPLTVQHAREHRWQASGIDFSLGIREDLAMVSIPLALLVVGAAAIAPLISVRHVVEYVQSLTKGQADMARGPIGRSLGLVPQPGTPTPFDLARAPGLPRSHLLGSGRELSKEVVMLVSTGDLAPGLPDMVAAHMSPPSYYWRGYSYDIYTGSGWLSDRTQTIAYAAGEQAVFDPAGRAASANRPVPVAEPGYRTVRQSVKLVGKTDNALYVAGRLVTADHDYSIAWRNSADMFGANIGATAYRADSLLSTVSEEELRAAGTDYPEWILDSYLQLPERLPTRVRSLALDLTATASNPYDRALAIESYLRTYEYSLNVTVPPVRQDVADYFLFDLKKGYCDYYATAMVVLARAAGMPARLVMGYASGSYDSMAGQYVVTEADAHSWPEIYFPHHGWIEFEPTAGRPPIRRPAKEAPPPAAGKTPPMEPLVPARLWSNWLWLPAGLALLAVAWGVWSAVDGLRLYWLSPPAMAATLYARLQRHGRRLDVPIRAGDTPYEFAESLTRRMADRAQKRRWGTFLSPAAQEVRSLADLYVRTSYSPRLPDPDERVRAVQVWRRLQRRLWLARL